MAAAYDPRPEIKRLTDELQKLSSQIESTSASAARVAVIEECSKIKESIDDRIDKRFKSGLVHTAFLMALIAGIGYFGIQTTIPRAVQDAIGSDARKEMEALRSRAVKAVDEIEASRATARKNPLILLQTDFGSKSPYMASLMGVIYNVNPQARIQVITSEINSFDLTHAAWSVWRSSRFYPEGTIFVVITNPGGLTKPPVVIKTSNGQLYVGYDNGCFDLVVQGYKLDAKYTIASPELTPVKFGDLFGGNDLFGPAAAKLSLGFPLEKVGPLEITYTPKLPGCRHNVGANFIEGTVMDVDKFGNVTTNITESDLDRLRIELEDTLQIKWKNSAVAMQLMETYGRVPPRSPVAISYDGLLQLALNRDSFAGRYSLKRGSIIEVRRGNG